MINKITRDTHPEVFRALDTGGWDYEDVLSSVHEKHDATTYHVLLLIDEGTTPDETLWGRWMCQMSCSYNYGLISSPDELVRMEQKEVTRVEWVPVQ